MPNLTQRVVNTFIKGLITEAGELTFPENASVDELNCDLNRDGTRRRRKAIIKENNFTESSFTVTDSTVLNFGEWKNVGNIAGKVYLVVQVGPSLYFYDKNALPFSAQTVGSSVSLLPYQASGGTSVASAKCQFVSILGNLVVVSEGLKPIFINEETNGSFTVTEITCRVRDFEWLGDKIEYSEEAASPSTKRIYDTMNSGWSGELGSAALTAYITAESAHPPLSHPWYSGKDSSGVFSVAEWKKVYSGTSLIGNGHYLYELWDIDRDAATGLSGLPSEEEVTRFTTVVSFAGRAFFSGLTSVKNSGKIYYSQILQDIRSIGDFYQQNDPTSEEISDILETDGGVIVIPEAVNIRRLYAFRNSLFVFAENGVWQIQGVDNVFSPSAYSVSKITEIGIASPWSFVSAEGVPFWWSVVGIHTLSFNEYGNGSEENLSISTIQTFWNNIDNNAKSEVRGEYDAINKKILWLYPRQGESTRGKLSRVLLLDITLQAFYPWEFSDSDSANDYVFGFAYYSGFGKGETTFDVSTSEGDDVISDSDTVIVTLEDELSNSEISIVFFVRTANDRMTMATVTGEDFFDWGDADYTSYAVTGYDFVGDLALKKNAPYILTMLRETETGWEGDETLGYNPIGESSLFLSGYWDFKKLPSSAPQQVYRRRQPTLVDASSLSTFTSPATVIQSKTKIRGTGRSLRIKLESETGKDFIYIGHSLIADVSTRF